MQLATAETTLDSYFDRQSQSTIAKDLKLNLKRILEESALSKEEALLALLAVSSSLEHEELRNFASIELVTLGLESSQIQEAAESAALMGMLNTYYRFKHYLSHSKEANVDENYKTAGLRMTGLARPVLGKQRFEMLAFAVSVINGCEKCITSHEEVLRESQVEANKIHDLARLAAVVKGLRTLNFVSAR